ncbi:hypothetical protein NPIL_696441 [Nephila pilipes]|uniref:Uncharacterized protein n=1 Tax=Nephila pilipes TaxID=299642 RepID=A0A8X6R2Z3_NEPPI|nr:hypothetical protein NPIL_696441 [Nephila pilipes]
MDASTFDGRTQRITLIVLFQSSVMISAEGRKFIKSHHKDDSWFHHFTLTTECSENLLSRITRDDSWFHHFTLTTECSHKTSSPRQLPQIQSLIEKVMATMFLAIMFFTISLDINTVYSGG